MRVHRAPGDRFGYLLRDVRHRGKTYPVAYAFPLEHAPEALGVSRGAVQDSLALLFEHGDLATYDESAPGHRYTRPVKLDGRNRRLVVVLGCRQRLQCERLARAYRWDRREQARAARVQYA